MDNKLKNIGLSEAFWLYGPILLFSAEIILALIYAPIVLAFKIPENHAELIRFFIFFIEVFAYSLIIWMGANNCKNKTLSLIAKIYAVAVLIFIFVSFGNLVTRKAQSPKGIMSDVSFSAVGWADKGSPASRLSAISIFGVWPANAEVNRERSCPAKR